MANIQPFRGIRHSTEKFDNLADFYAPPYDVISERQREQLIAKSDHNIVRIDFGEQLPTDGTGENRYHRAKRLLDEWMAEGALVLTPGRALARRVSQSGPVSKRYARALP